MQRTYLGTNKEMFNAELYEMGEALGFAVQNRRPELEANRHQWELRWMGVYM